LYKCTVFSSIIAAFPNFSFHIALSDPQPEDDWKGAVGFIHQVLFDKYLQTHPEPEEAEYYLCGPPLMTSATTEMLDNLGVPKEHILFDDFGG
jgi:Na+-transporting NADH:ubiquinone oxidoreductase subunit F